MTIVIEGPRYEAVRQQLREDPLVQQMARELHHVPLTAIAYEGDEEGSMEPKWHFMNGANQEYTSRGGSVLDRHIGAVAEVLLELRRSQT